MPRSFSNWSVAGQVAALVLAAGMLAGAFFLFGVPGVVPPVWRISARKLQLEKEVPRLRAQNDKLEVYRKQQDVLSERIAQMKQQIKILGEILPDDPAAETFTRSIHDAGKAARVRVQTLVASPQVPREVYVEMPFALNAQGPFQSLTNFYDRLSRLKRLTSSECSSWESHATGGAATSDRWLATCVVTTYYNK